MLTQSNQTRRHLNPEERDLLERFARFDIGLEALVLGLKGMLVLDFGPMERKLTSYFLLPEPGIRITKEHVVRALDKHWKREVADDELRRWALMLLLNEAFEWEGPDEDYIAEALNELAVGAPHSEEA